MVVAAKGDLALRTLDDLWSGYAIKDDAVTVRRAIGHLPPLVAGQQDPNDCEHASPRFASIDTARRIAAIPHDGGSWRDLIDDRGLEQYLTPAMRELVKAHRLGSHPDVYGRARWYSPMATIKRECGHVGNGRYGHPDQDRLLSLREMAILNGFPRGYGFAGASLVNKYRHVGDAVPPLISYQLAWLAAWILSGERPAISEVLLPNSHLVKSDLMAAPEASRVAA